MFTHMLKGVRWDGTPSLLLPPRSRGLRAKLLSRLQNDTPWCGIAQVEGAQNAARKLPRLDRAIRAETTLTDGDYPVYETPGPIHRSRRA